MILVLDNYDSFTFNLVQAMRALAAEVRVLRNDELDVDQILELAPAAVVISPGPGRPEDAGISLDLIRRSAGALPILGVCLGHQAIGMAFGGRVVGAERLMHGKTSEVHHDGRTIYDRLSNPFTAMRYHSLVVERESVPACFEVSAWTEDRQIMGLRHRHLPIEGVQFHPESFLTAAGTALLRNFLEIYATRNTLAADQADRA